MKTQPQLLLESIVPRRETRVTYVVPPDVPGVPEWVHEQWEKEIAQKWEIKVAGEMLESVLRETLDVLALVGDRPLYAKAQVALERWEKANPPLKGWDQ